MYKKQYIHLFLLLVIALLSYLLIRKTPTESDESYHSDTIMEQISYLQELSLVRYNYSGVIDYEQYLKLMNHAVPMTKKSFLIRYTGYVKAGIDMSKVSVEVDEKNITILLPQPSIMATVIDEKSLKTYDETTNLLNPIRLSDYKKAIVREKQKISKAAIDKGILTTSSRQAHQYITTMLTQMGYENIQIVEQKNNPPPANMTDGWRNYPQIPHKIEDLFPKKP